MGSPAEASTRLFALDFSAELQRLTTDFTGRTWLLAEIDRWMADPHGASLFLLTGEPGVGKSAITARVIQTRPDVPAYHFCIAGRSETIVPSIALRSLAAQLGERLPGYGAALANTVKPTHLTVNVDIKVETMTGGQITGVVIKNLTVLDPQTELEVLLRGPLAALPAPERPQLIVIDSLDEAATLRSDPTLVSLLSGLDGLPSWLRILCTTRPERNVLTYFDRLSPYILAAESRFNLDDIRQYVTMRVRKPGLREKLAAAEQAEASVVTHLAGAPGSEEAGLAGGNFLYVKMLLNDIEAGRQSLADLDALPSSLDEIYHSFLLRIRPEWKQSFRPVFGVLAVSLEPLTEAQLIAFTGQKRTDLGDNLDVMRQFLDVGRDAGGNEAFRLFHQSLRDYLLDDKRSKDFRCAAEDFHDEIAGYYFRELAEEWAGDWANCDDYGLKYLPQHLSRMGDDRRLAGLLLDYRWLQAKLERTDVRAVIADLSIAIADKGITATNCEALSLLLRGIRLSAHILAVDKAQLAAQLTGRLMTAGHPSIQALLGQAVEKAARPWLRPVNSGLLQATSQIMYVLSTHTYPVSAVALTPAGDRAISAADDGLLKVWNVQTGEELRTLRGHTGRVLAVAVALDGQVAVSGSEDKTLRVWDLATYRQLLCIEAHDAAVSAVAITADGQAIVSGSYDATVKLWELKTGAHRGTLRGHSGGVNALALTPDGKRAVSGSYDRTLKLWDLASGAEAHTFYGHGDQVSAVAISPDGRWMASGSFDRAVKLWDLENRAEVYTFAGHDDVVTSVAIGPDGRMISGSADSRLHVWDLGSHTATGVLEGHSFRVTGVVITHDGRRAISSSGDTTLIIWDLTASMALPDSDERAGFLCALTITSDGRFAVSMSRDQAQEIFRVWDLSSGLALHTSYNALNFAKDDVLLVAYSNEQALQVRSTQDGTGVVLPLAGWIDRKTILVPGGQVLEFRDLRTQVIRMSIPGSPEIERTFVGHKSEVYDVAVTPDGRLLTASNDRTVGIWDLQTAQNLGFLTGHTREIWCVAAAMAGRTAVSCSDDRSVIVWDLERQAALARFTADGALTACAITRDGKTVISGDEAGRMYTLQVMR